MIKKGFGKETMLTPIEPMFNYDWTCHLYVNLWEENVL